MQKGRVQQSRESMAQTEYTDVQRNVPLSIRSAHPQIAKFRWDRRPGMIADQEERRTTCRVEQSKWCCIVRT